MAETHEELVIAALKCDARFQLRFEDELDMKHVKRMQPNIDKLPAVDVFRLTDGELIGDVLVDGFHRREVFVREGRTTIPATVHNGDLGDALWFAAGCNRTGSKADDEKSVRKAAFVLFDARKAKLFGHRTDTAIAEQLQIDRSWISKLRREWEGNGARPEDAPSKEKKKRRKKAAPVGGRSSSRPDDEDEDEDDEDDDDDLDDDDEDDDGPDLPPGMARALADAADIRENMAKKPADAQEQQRAGLRTNAREGLEASARALAALGFLDDEDREDLERMMAKVRD